MTLAAKTLNFTLTKLVKQERNPENVEKYVLSGKKEIGGEGEYKFKKEFAFVTTTKLKDKLWREKNRNTVETQKAGQLTYKL